MFQPKITSLIKNTTHRDAASRKTYQATMTTPCAQRAQSILAQELLDPSTPTVSELQLCGHEVVDVLKNAVKHLGNDSHADQRISLQLERLAHDAYAQLQSAPRSQAGRWMRLYSDANILRSLADVHLFATTEDEIVILLSIARLDQCIIVAGAHGEGRLDLIIGLIRELQTQYLNFVAPSTFPMPPAFSGTRHISLRPELTTSAKSIPRLDSPPSLTSFISCHSRGPFIIPGFLLDCPALNEHPWGSFEYLRAVAGPGRIVPVEVGNDYREDSWTQKQMSWNDFLKTLEDTSHEDDQPVTYLAQHNLFAQFPALRSDVIVPDYVYSSLPAPEDYSDYSPPSNDEQLVMNVWLGPAGAISPAHTVRYVFEDPYYNFFAQVVGKKTVWLAPPRTTPSMYPYPPPSEFSADQPRNPAANNSAPSMSNTSQVQVFPHSNKDSERDRANFPLFWEHVVGEAMSVVLEPGDLLFFPPGWWHGMRSEETSFSVSMWF